MSQLKAFKTLLAQGKDSELLRYSLGNEYLKAKDYEQAIIHFKKAIELKPTYSAAWKLYARSLAKNQQPLEAMTAYENGIKIAEENGDKQAAKEMRIFLKRLNG